mgnify:FL=1
MKTPRPYPRAIITPKGERAALGGHPWVYEAEVERLESPAGEPAAQPPEDGSLVDVLTEKGRYIGTGFYNHHSKIRVRLISRSANDRFDEAFWERKLRYAWDYRKTVMGGEGSPDLACCRVIFGEADGFPGLTVDRFSEILVAQTLSLGIEQRKEVIFPLLVKILREDGQEIRGLYERNDVSIRRLEGLEEGKGFYPLPGEEAPACTETEIVENGVRYRVDFRDGQKTGFFLDQKYNRQAVARLAKGKRVLDCFTHTGSFALNAAKGGAAFVRAVDVSETAVELSRQNAALNGLDGQMEFVAANVFDLLPQLEESHDPADRFDFIILDPPAFTKSRKTVDSAFRGYKEINLRAMRLLPRGGYLATASCSHFMEESRFIKMLHSAAHDAGRELRQIEVRQQAPDHPVLWNVPETAYLKFFLFQVV